MQDLVLVKRIAKRVPLKDDSDFCDFVFNDGTRAIGLYEHFDGKDLAVVVPARLVYKGWFFTMFYSKFTKNDLFCLPVELFRITTVIEQTDPSPKQMIDALEEELEKISHSG